MKQKIVMKVHKISSCDKCRIKAMKIVAAAPGVISVGIEGNEMDQVVVIGEEVDCTTLTSKLRKKLKHAKIISVEQVHDYTEEAPQGYKEEAPQDFTETAAQETTEFPKPSTPAACNCYCDSIPYTNISPPNNHMLYVVHEEPNPCSIL